MPQSFSLNLLLSIVLRRRLIILAVFSSVFLSALLFARLTPAEYEAKTRLILDERSAGTSDLERDLTSLPEFGGAANPLATQAELVGSQRVLQLTIESLEEAGLPPRFQSITPGDIRDNLEVNILPATNILELSLIGNDPEATATIVNTLANAVVAENAETLSLRAGKVRQFLEARIPEAQFLLERLEQAEQRYRQTSGIVSLPEQTGTLVGSLAELENQERFLVAELDSVGSRITSLQQITNVTSLQNAYASVRAGQDEDLRRFRNQLTELEIVLSETRSRLGEQHPDLLALEEQKVALSQQYFNQLSIQAPSGVFGQPALLATDELSQTLISDLILSEIEFLGLTRRREQLRVAQETLRQALAELPEKQQILARLLREQEDAEVSLRLLQTKLEEARIAEAQQISQVRIIEEARVPGGASWPNFPVVIVLATMSGTVLALGVGLLAEVSDDRIHNEIDLKALVDLPVLGAVPSASQLSLDPADKITHLLNDPLFVEAYRRVIQTIEFSTGKTSNCIVVSSVYDKDNNEDEIASIAALLAIVAANLSRRTLLIDANLRSPHQGEMLDLSTDLGLTDLINQEASLLQTAQVKYSEWLSVIPAGACLTNPSFLIESGITRKILDQASAQFDWVIIDTPSCGYWRDAITLAQQSDGIALMISPNVTSRDRIQSVISETKESKVTLLGTVMNQGDRRVETDDSRRSRVLPKLSAPALFGSNNKKNMDKGSKRYTLEELKNIKDAKFDSDKKNR
ncbi:MAG: GumC family protein [Leptolyngbyaceae cyanobacterium]